MSTFRAFTASGLAEVPFAHGAVVPPSSRLVLLGGLCPLDDGGAVRHPGDVAGQMHAVLDNAVIALGEIGADVSHLARARISVASTRREDLYAAWSAFSERLDTSRLPSTLVGVTVLGYEHQLVEVEFDAVLPAT